MKYSKMPFFYFQQKQNIKTIVKATLLHLFQVFKSSDRIQVWQKKDRYGHTYWQAYNLTTDRKISLASEAEIRIWIEQQYYK